MNPEKSLPAEDSQSEIAALVETLHLTEQRLETLTAGEVDSVTGRDGRTLLLRRAQDHMRLADAAKQAAILNALPAHVALLDGSGVIVSVNQAWRRFADSNGLHSPGHAIGINYLDICDRATGKDAIEAAVVANGIRAVLGGEARSFSIEYPCHSPTEQRWFLMTVSPLDGEHLNGTVVMHVNVTAERLSDERYRLLFDASMDAVLLTALDSHILAANVAACHMFGRTERELQEASQSQIVDESDPRVPVALEQRRRTGRFTGELTFVRKNGARFAGEISSATFQDKDGLPTTSMIIRDISERKKIERMVRDSEKRFRAVFDQAPIGMALLDSEGHPVVSNPTLSRMLGYSPAELSKMTFREFTYGEDIDKDVAQFALLMAGKIPAYQLEKRYVHKNGNLIWARLSVTLLRDENGLTQDIVGMTEDITQYKEAELRIAYLNRVYALLSGINALIVRAHDRDTLFNGACRIAVEEGGFIMAMLAMLDQDTGYIVPVASAGKDEALLDSIKAVLASHADRPSTMVARAMEGKTAVVANDSLSDPRVMFRKMYAESGVRSMIVLPLVIDDKAVGVMALYAREAAFFQTDELRLLTELAGDVAFAIDHLDKRARLDYLAYYDDLTGLANRTLFMERVAQYMRSAVSSGHRLALFVMDLQRFRNINDSLGRPVGDELLKQVGAWLAINAKDRNLVARLDADLFALVLPVISDKQELGKLIDHQMDAFLEHPYRLNDSVFRMAFRCGVAIFPDDGNNVDSLIRNAEAALKKAKQSGSRYLFYTQNMNEKVTDNLNLENRLREALAREEFVLHYQPKVNLVTGKVTSAEALIRWNDPVTGLVPPGRFIPILEETGLIYDVGRWALRKALDDYLRWRALGLPAVRIAVNVSPLQLRNADFVAEIGRAIGIDAHAAEGLELEITESLIMEDVRHNIDSLQAIRALGVSIAIDDFGTGFSSLAYLAKLPIDTIKIDRAFVVDMTAGPQGLSLVSTIINLAHSLKFKVVAEGVETEEQSRLLRLLGCDEMQGFLFSKPVPVELFEATFLASHQAG
jgi:diguanylate cyclase (GGDEF)-like protein/PAS domain S-box-containing protein